MLQSMGSQRVGHNRATELNWTEGFPGGSDGKESACNAGDPGSICGSGRSPGGGHDNPLQYFCLENPYSPWSREELDKTAQLTLLLFKASLSLKFQNNF